MVSIHMTFEEVGHYLEVVHARAVAVVQPTECIPAKFYDFAPRNLEYEIVENFGMSFELFAILNDGMKVRLTYCSTFSGYRTATATRDFDKKSYDDQCLILLGTIVAVSYLARER